MRCPAGPPRTADRRACRGRRRRAHHRLDRPRGATGARAAVAVGGRRAGRHQRRRAAGPATRSGVPYRSTRRTNVWVWSPSGSVVASASCGTAGHDGSVPPRQADASRRRNGPRKTARGLGARPRRSRCGLEVSPAPPRAVRCGVRRGRRPVVAEKLREPQQAVVGSKTRSAGRTPPTPQSHGPSPGLVTAACPGARTSNRTIGRFIDGRRGQQAGTARCRTGSASHVEEKLARLGEARPSDHPGRGRGRRSATRARRTAPCGSSSPPSRRGR